MPVLSDFTVIQFSPHDVIFEDPFQIGDNGASSLSVPFNTGGLHHSPALLTLMVRALTSGSARVRINGHDIGRIEQMPDPDIWRHEQFVIKTNVLNSGNNTLLIDAVPTGSSFDDFLVRDIVCFFHQEA